MKLVAKELRLVTFRDLIAAACGTLLTFAAASSAALEPSPCGARIDRLKSTFGEHEGH
jgi:hypothetical protein